MTAISQERAVELQNCHCCGLTARKAQSELQYPEYRVWWDRHVVRPVKPEEA